MDINELNKKQLVLVTLLSTFVVSIGTGIITVSLMNEVPKTVPQTINNVIQRTIEKVSNDETVNTDKKQENKNTDQKMYVDENLLISVFKKEQVKSSTSENDETKDVKNVGQGLIISDLGLILLDSSMIQSGNEYATEIGGKNFDLSLVKKFDNGLSVVKMSPSLEKPKEDITKPKNQ